MNYANVFQSDVTMIISCTINIIVLFYKHAWSYLKYFEFAQTHPPLSLLMELASSSKK